MEDASKPQEETGTARPGAGAQSGRGTGRPEVSDAPATGGDSIQTALPSGVGSDLAEASDRPVGVGPVVTVSGGEARLDIGVTPNGVPPSAASAGAGLSRPSGISATAFHPGSDVPRLPLRRAVDADAWRRMEQAHRDGLEVEGVVQEQVKGGLVLDVGLRAFLPASQVERAYVADLAPYVGQTLRARVLELDYSHGKVILSRRAVLDAAARVRREQVWAELEEGQVRDGVVKGLTDFGAFVDLGGVDGLLHVSAMSWNHIERPSDMLSVGDPIRVKILKLDRERKKISLGLKQVQPDPWTGVAERYPVGSAVEGKVMRLCSFGAFVELQPGVDGLIHISQMSDQRVREPGLVLHEGQAVRATVLRVAPAERRISLSLRTVPAALPHPPARVSASHESSITVGDVVGDLGRLLQEGLRDRQGPVRPGGLHDT